MVRCPLCGEEFGSMDSLRYHFGKVHMMDFKDNADMERRLAAIGIDVEEDTKVVVQDQGYKPIIG